MSHTSGPWLASHYLDTDEVGVVSMSNEIVVGLSSRITEDNARLIAAAPEMLGALHGAKALLEYGGIKPDNAILASVLAAITKATGDKQ